MPIAAIAGGAAGGVALLAIAAFLIWWFGCRRRSRKAGGGGEDKTGVYRGIQQHQQLQQQDASMAVAAYAFGEPGKYGATPASTTVAATPTSGSVAPYGHPVQQGYGSAQAGVYGAPFTTGTISPSSAYGGVGYQQQQQQQWGYQHQQHPQELAAVTRPSELPAPNELGSVGNRAELR